MARIKVSKGYRSEFTIKFLRRFDYSSLDPEIPYSRRSSHRRRGGVWGKLQSGYITLGDPEIPPNLLEIFPWETINEILCCVTDQETMNEIKAIPELYKYFDKDVAYHAFDLMLESLGVGCYWRAIRRVNS